MGQMAALDEKAKSRVSKRKSPRIVYPKPPIEEALCEFRFGGGPEWDITLPGLLYEKLRETYPGKPEVLVSDLAQSEKAGAEPPRPRIVLTSEDRREWVRFSEDFLSIHVAAPYPGWEVFYSRMRQVLSTYIRVINPSELAFVALRYKNRINVPGERVVLQDYFTVNTTVPPNIPPNIARFSTRIRAYYADDERTALTFGLSSVDPRPDENVNLVAQLDVSATRAHIHERLVAGDVLKIIRDLKYREADAFEALITDRTRDLFR